MDMQPLPLPSEELPQPRVLMVDDEQLLLNVYRRVLEFECDLFLASSGNEALEIIQEHGPFTVVVSDYRMPGMDGHELITEIRKTDQRVICAMLTGNQMDETTRDKLESHAFSVLTKPCKTSDILDVVQRGHQAYLASLELDQETEPSTAIS